MGLVEETEKLLKRLKGHDAKLNEFQVQAIETIEKTDGNILVIAPTGAGKTVVGVSAIAKYGRGFYLAPLRSLMMEKYVEIRRMFPNKKVVLTNKDYSVPRLVIKESDIRIMSPYKFMLYFDYLEPDDGVVVVDEIHKIHCDPDMEAAVTEMKMDGFRIVGLSATIHDDDIPRMSRWLNATVVKHGRKRPVPLKFVEVKLDLTEMGSVAVVGGGGILKEGEVYPTKEEAVAEVVSRILSSDPGGGVMIWAPTRSEADRYAALMRRRLPQRLVGISKNVVKSSEHDHILATCLEHGVGIHHGGISPKNRELVEDLFRGKRINVVSSCYTLSHGVNLPVRYMVITTLFDYDGNFVNPSTFHQVAGRAGRPGLDDFGVVVVVTVGDLESFVLSKILAEGSGRLHSRLHNMWTLTKLLAQRLSMDRSIEGARRFISETYYVQERGQPGYEELKALVEECLTTVIDAYFDLGSSGVVRPKGKEEWIAAAMGLHPDEWSIRKPAASGNYDETVSAAVEVAMKARGIDDARVATVVKNYGLLSTYVGGWKVRDLADATQTILDAVALYLRRVYGWKSKEFENGKRVAELFTYGGNPKVEILKNVLRHDEMKRIVRNMPDIVFTNEPDPDTMEIYVRNVVNLIFGVKKVISLSRVKKVATTLVTMMYDDPEPDVVDLGVRVAVDEAKRIAREFGSKVK